MTEICSECSPPLANFISLALRLTCSTDFVISHTKLSCFIQLSTPPAHLPPRLARPIPSYGRTYTFGIAVWGTVFYDEVQGRCSSTLGHRILMMTKGSIVRQLTTGRHDERAEDLHGCN